MNEILNISIQYLKGFIHEDEIFIEKVPSNDEWKQIFQVFMEQDLAVLIFPFISSVTNEKRPEKEFYEYWFKRVRASVIVHYQDLGANLTMVKDLRLNGIEAMVVKGVSVSKHYSKPEYRLMRDIDLYVREEDYLAAESTLISLGYSLIKSEMMHSIYIKAPNSFVELHKMLYYSKYSRALNLDNWQNNLWDRSKTFGVDGTELIIMSDEDILIHQIVHLALHLVHTGAVFRQIMDISMIIKTQSLDFDWKYVENNLLQIGLIDFAGNVFKSVVFLFDISIPEEMLMHGECEPLAFTGIFFSEYAVEKESGQYQCFAYVSNHFPILCRYSVFTPVIWVGELLAGIIYHKKSIIESMFNANAHLQRYESSRKILKRLDLNHI